jgi:hypothetical protein
MSFDKGPCGFLEDEDCKVKKKETGKAIKKVSRRRETIVSETSLLCLGGERT